MLALGHSGIMLLVYAPIAYVLLVTGREKAMGTGLILALFLSLSPDIDMWLPFVAHRGLTHSLLAAVCVGVAVGIAGWLSSLWSVGNGSERAALGFFIGSVSIVTHLVGDVITPMGIKLFLPVSQTTYSVDIVSAFDPAANSILFIVGGVAYWMANHHARLRIAARAPAAARSSTDSVASQPQGTALDIERPAHPPVRTGASNRYRTGTDVAPAEMGD